MFKFDKIDKVAFFIRIQISIPTDMVSSDAHLYNKLCISFFLYSSIYSIIYLFIEFYK